MNIEITEARYNELVRKEHDWELLISAILNNKCIPSDDNGLICRISGEVGKLLIGQEFTWHVERRKEAERREVEKWRAKQSQK